MSRPSFSRMHAPRPDSVLSVNRLGHGSSVDMSRPTAEWEVAAKGLAKKAVKEKDLFAQLLQGILSKEDKTRYTSFKALMFIAGERPEFLYPYWDRFAELIDNDNTHSKYIASYLIASLTLVDRDNRFEGIFDKYYGLLNDKSIIPAAHVAANSGKIARAKPKLQAKITEKLLNIDKTHHNPDHNELIKSHAIEAFGEYFEQAKDKKRIVEFVRNQLKSKSPKTRKKAKEFLEKWMNEKP